MDNTLWPASCPTCSRYEERSHKNCPFQDLNVYGQELLSKTCSKTVLILFSCSKTAQIMFNCSNTAQIMSNTVLIGSAGPRQDYNSFWTGFEQFLNRFWTVFEQELIYAANLLKYCSNTVHILLTDSIVIRTGLEQFLDRFWTGAPVHKLFKSWTGQFLWVPSRTSINERHILNWIGTK